MDPSRRSVASSFHMERGLIIPHQRLNQHLIISSLRLLWKALCKYHFYVFSLIIKNGCYLLMISLISFFNTTPQTSCAARCLASFASECAYFDLRTQLLVATDIQTISYFEMHVNVSFKVVGADELHWYCRFRGSVCAQLQNKNTQPDFFFLFHALLATT